MTATTDLDGKLRAWLDLMPYEAPDRAIADVLQAVEVVPQGRVTIRSALERTTHMNRFSAAAIAAAAVVIVAVSALLIGRPSSNVASTSPAPASAPPASASTSPSSAAAVVPAALQHAWIGAPRVAPAGSDLQGLDLSAQTVLRISSDTVRVTGMTNLPDALRSTIRISGDRFTVTPTGSDGCNGSSGQYIWQLSPKGSHLSLSVGGDPCQSRMAAFIGDWYRVACQDPNNNCWGDMDAGTYPTNNFGPDLDPALPARPDFGALTFTVPDGWSISSDHTSDIGLLRSSDYAKAGPDGALPPTADIEAWIRPAANLQGHGCATAIQPGIGRTPKALTDWLASLPALDATVPTAVTIGGHAGWSIDVGVAASFTGNCPPDWPQPTVPLFTEGIGKAGSVGDQPYQTGLTGPQKARVILLDIGGGRAVLILINAPDQAAFVAFLPAAMPIVQSFHFR